MKQHKQGTESMRTRRNWKRGLSLALGGTMVALVAACSPATPETKEADSESHTVRVVTNFGTIYYGLLLGLDLLVEERPDVKIEHVQLSAGGDSLTAIAANQADLVSVGVSPLLIAREKGVPAKFGGALVTAHVALVAKDSKFKSLADFGPDDRIATPGPFAVGSIALLGASMGESGGWQATQEKFRIMPHPDAVTALQQGEVQGHMATPPFLQQNLANGAHEVLGGEDLLGAPIPLGDFAFSEAFHEKNPKLYAALVAAIEAGTAMINDDPKKAAARIATLSSVKVSEDQVFQEITTQGIDFDTTFSGYTEVRDTMLEMGLIKKKVSLAEVSFDNVTGK
jgi:NitT/TauT family transport system substrate-binding protein